MKTEIQQSNDFDEEKEHIDRQAKIQKIKDLTKRRKIHKIIKEALEKKALKKKANNVDHTS